MLSRRGFLGRAAAVAAGLLGWKAKAFAPPDEWVRTFWAGTTGDIFNHCGRLHATFPDMLCEDIRWEREDCNDEGRWLVRMTYRRLPESKRFLELRNSRGDVLGRQPLYAVAPPLPPDWREVAT